METSFIILCAIIATAVHAVSLENRILGGRQEDFNLTPYQVSISLNDRPICSGSIIASKWILTAAHCLNSLENYPIEVSVKIRAGSPNQFSGGVVIPASKFFVHKSFNQVTYDSDIALIQLSEALSFNSNIQAVTLPEKGASVPERVAARIAGWGRSETQSQNILLRATVVFTISQKVCENWYGNALTDRMICAGFIGSEDGFSDGDGGGALVAGGIQYGIISHRLENDKFTGLYTNVVKFLDFIYDTINGRP